MVRFLSGTEESWALSESLDGCECVCVVGSLVTAFERLKFLKIFHP